VFAGIQRPAELWTYHRRPAWHICFNWIWHSSWWTCAIFYT